MLRKILIDEIENSIPPLELNESYVIDYRTEDCYINVIDLCNAGEKKILRMVFSF